MVSNETAGIPTGVQRNDWDHGPSTLDRLVGHGDGSRRPCVRRQSRAPDDRGKVLDMGEMPHIPIQRGVSVGRSLFRSHEAAFCPVGRHPSPNRHAAVRLIASRQTEPRWGRWDSNPHWHGPKPCASANWATAPRRLPGPQLARPSSVSTRATWPVALTLRQACSMRPSAPTTKVDRITPCTVLPYIFFSPNAP